MIKRKNVRKKVLLFICTIVLSFQAFTATAFASSTYLNVEKISQEKGQWCWAASSKCVIDYLKQVYPTQSDIVTFIFGSPVDEGGTIVDIQNVLSKYNVTSTINYASVSYATTKDNISGWYSPMIALETDKIFGGGHAVVIYGYNETSTSQNISYMDPGNGGLFSDTYGHFSSNLSSAWVGTVYYNH